jgi:hypothetical protein
MCSSGYKVIGNKIRTCKNGSWNGKEPKCTGVVVAPTNVKLTITPSGLNVSWDPPCTGPPSTSYKITYMHISAGETHSMYQITRTVDDPTETSYTITDVLGDDVTHMVVVTAVSGDASATSELAYLYTSCSSPATNIKIEQGEESEGSVTLKWAPPPHRTKRGFHPPPDEYLVVYFSLDGRSSIGRAEGSETEYVLHLDAPIYVVALITHSSGTSYSACAYIPQKITLSYNDAECKDCSPSIINIKSDNETHINVSWEQCVGFPDTKYIVTALPISAGKVLSNAPPITQDLSPTATSTMFSNLTLAAGSTHIFVVTAVSGSEMVSSKPSQYSIAHKPPLPSPPTNVNAVQVTRRSANVSWTPQLEGTSTAICYVAIHPDAVKKLTLVDSSNTQTTLKMLREGQTYIVVVLTVRDNELVSQPSNAVLLNLDPDFPLCVTMKDYLPAITKVAPLDLTSLRLSWAHPCDGPPTTSYVIAMLPITIVDAVVTNQDATYTTVGNLATTAMIQQTRRPDTTYIFVVSAVSGNRYIPSEPKHLIPDGVADLLSPTIVSVDTLTPTSARVTWTPPEGVRPNIYSICFVPTNPGGEKILTAVAGTVKTHVLTGLDYESSYLVLVIASAETSAGTSDAVSFTLHEWDG